MGVPEPVDLRRLLSYLSLTRQHIAPLEALQIVRTTGPTEALPAELEGTIESIRRVAYAGNDYRQSGLFEFQLALLFMDGKRNADATTHFGQARLQWNLVGDVDLICLACFAQGVAWHHAYDYERAAPNYLETKRQIEAALARTERWGVRQSDDQQKFWNEIEELLNEAMLELQESMGRYFRARLLPLIVVQEPIIADDLSDIGKQVKGTGRCSLYFDVSDPLRLDEYREVVLPVVNSIDKINSSLSRLLGLDRAVALTVEQLGDDDALEIRLNGCLAETTALCKRLFEDRLFHDYHAKQVRQLERATLELERLKRPAQLDQSIDAVKRDELEVEIRQIEVSLSELRTRKAKGLLDQCVPGVATAELRSAVALAISPSLKVLVESLTRYGVSLSPDTGT
jgi:hypothetical protein